MRGRAAPCWPHAAAEAVLGEVANGDVDDVARELGQQDLTAVAGGRDARGALDIQAHVDGLAPEAPYGARESTGPAPPTRGSEPTSAEGIGRLLTRLTPVGGSRPTRSARPYRKPVPRLSAVSDPSLSAPKPRCQPSNTDGT
jgi:hypothetical protein